MSHRVPCVCPSYLLLFFSRFTMIHNICVSTCILVPVTIYSRLLIGQDGHLRYIVTCTRIRALAVPRKNRKQLLFTFQVNSLRHWLNIDPPLAQCLVLAEVLYTLSDPAAPCHGFCETPPCHVIPFHPAGHPAQVLYLMSYSRHYTICFKV